MNKVEEAYFDFLKKKIIWNGKPAQKDFDKVLGVLFEVPYKSEKLLDDARVKDGAALRVEFCDKESSAGIFVTGSYDEDLKSITREGTSLFEVLVSLATRLEREEGRVPKYGDRTPVWFWYMLQNAGLTEFDDEHFDEKAVRDILDKIIALDYEKNGKGSFFVTKTETDMRELTLWKQACRWLSDSGLV